MRTYHALQIRESLHHISGPVSLAQTCGAPSQDIINSNLICHKTRKYLNSLRTLRHTAKFAVEHDPLQIRDAVHQCTLSVLPQVEVGIL